MGKHEKQEQAPDPKNNGKADVVPQKQKLGKHAITDDDSDPRPDVPAAPTSR